MSKIFAKLQAIQTALKAPKSQFNKFGGYSYRKAEDILEAVKPLLAENGCILTIGDDLVYVEGRYYIKATATICAVEDGSSICTTAFAREENEKKGMDGSQVTGASSSYARKYALNGLLCIDDTADSDTTNVGDGKEEKEQQQPKKKASAKKAAPASKVASISPEKYDAWVSAAARNILTKAGIPARDGFVNNFAPTEDELAAFDEAVLHFRLDNGIKANENINTEKAR